MRRTKQPPKQVTATAGGTCRANCGTRIVAGDKIRILNRKWYHRDCLPIATPRQRPTSISPQQLMRMNAKQRLAVNLAVADAAARAATASARRKARLAAQERFDSGNLDPHTLSRALTKVAGRT